jgi:membrane associated rhomboid family serine protease
LPESPGRDTYGFLAGGKLHTCTVEELIKQCSTVQIRDVSLVWTPDEPRLTPMTEVRVLEPAVDARTREQIGQAAFMIAAGSFMSYMSTWSRSEPSAWAFWALVVVLPGIQSLADGVLARRAARRRRGNPPPLDVPARFAYWISSQRSRGTYVLAIGIAVIAVCQLVRGLDASVADAGLVKDAVRRGEIWRLLTAGLLHVGIWHFAMNTGALLGLGRTVEILAHSSRLAIVFLLSILGGTLASLVLMPNTTSVGASGGLMGLLGFLLVLGLRCADALPPRFARSLIGGILWIAAAGIVGRAFIDNAAHLGGLLVGVGPFVPRGPEPVAEAKAALLAHFDPQCRGGGS